MIPLGEDEELVLTKKGTYSEMLNMLNSNPVSGERLEIRKRVTFKLPEPQNLPNKEIEKPKEKKPKNSKNLRPRSMSIGGALQNSVSIDLN